MHRKPGEEMTDIRASEFHLGRSPGVVIDGTATAAVAAARCNGKAGRATPIKPENRHIGLSPFYASKPGLAVEARTMPKTNRPQTALPTGKIERETTQGRAAVGDVPNAETLGTLARKVLSSSRHAESRELARAVLRLLARSKKQW
jgi:hypothetical protein